MSFSFLKFFESIELRPGQTSEFPLHFLEPTKKVRTSFVANTTGEIEKVIETDYVTVPLFDVLKVNLKQTALQLCLSAATPGFSGIDDAHMESLVRTIHRRAYGIHSVLRNKTTSIVADKRIQHVGVSGYDYRIYRIPMQEMGLYEKLGWKEHEAALFAVNEKSSAFVRPIYEEYSQGLAILDSSVITLNKIAL